ncbi:hypothetical protein [Nonomuraea guangzhouensis]|uniref:Uncharacterized protein n=1 Tax=Nonomuraea guangzhouensis TaxID=1291555 RepID=A0ABW4GY47_9ACTN|nr:hypothetical protein [Nonomuraea guangzhouensis]
MQQVIGLLAALLLMGGRARNQLNFATPAVKGKGSRRVSRFLFK